MSIMSRVLARMAGLPPALTHDVAVQHDLRVPMPDGVELLADHYYPRRDGTPPIVLMRTPYSRRQFGVFGQIFAERGYQAVIQSARGTFGSGGKFDAYRDEGRDGHATLEWLASQDWFGGSVGTYGSSYLGFAQWAEAVDASPYLRALAISIAASDRRDPLYPGESFALDSALTWLHTIVHQELPFWRVQWASVRQRQQLAAAFAHLPLDEADRLAFGRTIPFYQDWLEHYRPGDPFWEEIDYSRRLGTVSAEVNLVGGWYDYFLPCQLADYAALRKAGKHPYLTVGPWIHVDTGPIMAGLREGLVWFDARLRGDTSRLRPAPVRVFMMGSRRWLDLPDWPPPADQTSWYLQPGGGLSSEPPAYSQPDRYDYDPADPTPSVGGAVLGRHAGPKDNRRLESRPDVLTYTGAPLESDLEVIGQVIAELHVRSSLEHTDFFARLCDVEPGGRSVNVCDGLVRLWPGRFPHDSEGITTLQIRLWPTAHCFRRGHRLRLQVSSGAHPRFSRNPGSGEPLGTATTLRVAHQELYHDPERPSAVVLPVRAGLA